jgi:hypothetical protein
MFSSDKLSADTNIKYQSTKAICKLGTLIEFTLHSTIFSPRPDNKTSQNVLIKSGLINTGTIDYHNKEVLCFEILKQDIYLKEYSSLITNINFIKS